MQPVSPVTWVAGSVAPDYVSGGSSCSQARAGGSARHGRPPLPSEPMGASVSAVGYAPASRPQTPQPRTPRTPQTARTPGWSPVWTPRSSGTPRTPQQALLQWKADDFAEKQELSECIDALYKQRKSTLRFLRRCENTQELKALQTALDPQPRRTILSSGTSPAQSPAASLARGPVRAMPPSRPPIQVSDSNSLPVGGWESLAAPAASLLANCPRLAWPARTANLSSTKVAAPVASLTPRQPVSNFAFAAPARGRPPSPSRAVQVHRAPTAPNLDRRVSKAANSSGLTSRCPGDAVSPEP